MILYQTYLKLNFNTYDMGDYRKTPKLKKIGLLNLCVFSDLMVCMVVFLIFALVLCVAGFGVFCYACSLLSYMDQANKSWKLSTKWSGILIFLAGMFYFYGLRKAL